MSEVLLEEEVFTDDLGLDVKTVEEWLNGVSYADDPNYVPSQLFLLMYLIRTSSKKLLIISSI